MLAEFTAWLSDLVAQAFSDLFDLLKQAFFWIVDQVLAALEWLIAQIPVPEWLSSGMQTLFDSLPQGTLYILSQIGLATGLAMIGAGYAFRLTRKVVTLFQW